MGNLFFLLMILFTFNISGSISLKITRKGKKINLSNYAYPKPYEYADDGYHSDHDEKERPEKITIAILNTNDIHGMAFKEETSLGNTTYSRSGVELLGSYIYALKKEYNSHFLWLDSGDQYSGTLESKLTDGKIITDFFNVMGLTAATLGNHEFDWGKKKMSELLRSSNFPFIVNNIVRKDGKKLDLPNVVKYKMFDAGGVLVGVTGITTKYTPRTTAGDTSQYEFVDYAPQIIKYSNILRRKGAHIVILLAHAGIECNGPDYQKNRMTTEENDNGKCNGAGTSEIFRVLMELPKFTVDAVYAGHIHKSAHSFINGVPVLQNNFHALTANVGYFTFDAKTKKYLRDETAIEGPIPICSKVFSKSLDCQFFGTNVKNEDEIIRKKGELSEFYFHGTKIKPLKKVETVLDAYIKLVDKAKQRIITYVDVEMFKDRDHNSALANFVCDMLRNITKADFCLFNQGAFRGIWYPGNITYYKYYEMFSLVSEIVTARVTGKQLKAIMNIIQCGDKSFEATSGLTSYVTTKPRKCLVKVTQSDGREIDDMKTYTFVSNDFFINGGDDFAKVRKLFNVPIIRHYGEFKDITMDYLKSVPIITKDMVMHMDQPSLVFVKQS